MTVINPHMALDFRTFGIGVGVNVIQDEIIGYTPSPVSGHLRFGARDKVAFNLIVSEGAPLWNPAGAAEMRIDFPVGRRARFGIGLAAPVPYDQLGLVVRGRIELLRDVHLNVAGRIGDAPGGSENGFTLGLTVIPFHQGPR
jgi:hypothetical protein